MTLKMKRLSAEAVLPSRATAGSAGYDLSACLSEPIVLQAGETQMISTGIAMELPEGTAGMVYPRSGVATKYGVALPNCVGVVDSDYRGEVLVPLHNHGKKAFTIHHGDRIAQMVVTSVLLPEVEVVEELTESDRGINGFGSTGRKASAE